MPSSRVPLPGSNRELPPNAEVVSSSSDDSVQVTVVVRRRMPLPPVEPPFARYPSREEFARQYGADPADLEKVRAFAQQEGLTVISSDPGTRTVAVSGTAAQMEQAFGVKLLTAQSGGQTLRVRAGMIYLPAELQPIVEAVLGLDNRPPARSGYGV
jgi:kumamolisin